MLARADGLCWHADLYRQQAWETVGADAESLETHFSVQKRKRPSVGKKGGGDGEGKEKPAATSLLDLRRAQNTSIMLSKFRCSLARLREAIMQVLM